MVSFNLGLYYQKVASEETLADLETRMQEYNDKHMRWVVKDDNDNIVDTCPIHKRLVAMIGELQPV